MSDAGFGLAPVVLSPEEWVSTDLEREAVQVVRDIVCVAADPDSDFSEDGVDERIFAAKIEALVERTYHERVEAALA